MKANVIYKIVKSASANCAVEEYRKDAKGKWCMTRHVDCDEVIDTTKGDSGDE